MQRMDSRRIYRREMLGLFYFLPLPEKSIIGCNVVTWRWNRAQ